MKSSTPPPTPIRNNWDLYLRQGLFAYHVHTTKRFGWIRPGVFPPVRPELVLPSTATFNEKPLSEVENEEALQTRQQHVQSLGKYRTSAAEKLRTAIEKLASHRDETTFTDPIRAGDCHTIRPKLENQTTCQSGMRPLLS